MSALEWARDPGPAPAEDMPRAERKAWTEAFRRYEATGKRQKVIRTRGEYLVLEVAITTAARARILGYVPAKDEESTT